MKLRPLHNQVLVKPAEHEDVTESGLKIISDWDPDVTGTVTAVGHGLLCPKCGTRQHMAVNVGDEVVFPYNRGQTITIDRETYLSMTSDDILAKVEE